MTIFSRYSLKTSPRGGEWLLCTDKVIGLACEFRRGQFNVTQQFSVLGLDADVTRRFSAQDLAQACMEMGEWLLAYHHADTTGVEISAPLALGAQIAYLRRGQNYTVRELAHIISIDAANLNRIELGKANPSFSTIARITDALGAKINIIQDKF